MERTVRNASPAGRKHAVVAGAGVAGLLAAAALAASFAHVTIIERDDALAGAEPRRGVPQGRHAHALLPRGLAALERLFPGFAAGALARGAIALNAATAVSWGVGGHRLAAAPDNLPALASTRPFLESEIRRRVTEMDNVAFLTGARVADFVLQEGAAAGVLLECGRSGTIERLDAELVVDATGRASRLAVWLREHGFPAPTEEIMEVDVGYATTHFRADRKRLRGFRALVVGATPTCPRAGVVHAVEGGMIEVSLTGYRDEHPPATQEGFIAHAGSLALPDIHRLIHDAEPCSDIAVFRVARTVRRHYQKLNRLPPGIIALGDAVCAFNPVFAQGMTVAALEALALHEVLWQATDPRGTAFAHDFYRRAARALDPAWQMARGIDLLIPHLAHHASTPDRLMSRWIRRVIAAGARDPQTAKRFIRVASLIDPPPALLAPSLVLRVLFGRSNGATADAGLPDGMAAELGADERAA